jgi:hypothetical protein
LEAWESEASRSVCAREWSPSRRRLRDSICDAAAPLRSPTLEIDEVAAAGVAAERGEAGRGLASGGERAAGLALALALALGLDGLDLGSGSGEAEDGEETKLTNPGEEGDGDGDGDGEEEAPRLRLRVAAVAGAGGERKVGLDLGLALLDLDAPAPVARAATAVVALGLPMAVAVGWLCTGRFENGSACDAWHERIGQVLGLQQRTTRTALSRPENVGGTTRLVPRNEMNS